MSKRLLVVGGSSIHVFNFIKLVEDYFDEVLLLSNQKEESWKIPTVVVDFSIRKNGYRNFRHLKKIIEHFDPTVVHLHQADTKALLSLLALGRSPIPKILTAWGSDILLNPKKSLLERWKAEFILRHVDAVTADSEVVLDEAERLVGGLNRHNINFGIEKFPCHHQKEFILYSNRLHKKLYNIDKVILSFYKLFQSDGRWRLVLAGEGEESTNLKALVKELGIEEQVKFIGWVDAKTNHEYYCRAKIYLSIPQSDSISLSLVEAIASGCVVFVSDLPANREIITDNIGYIVADLENIPLLSYQKIDKFAYEKERELILNRFSKSYNRDAYIKLYEEGGVL
jgi:glycosyltransferase involved in cell wall biosynthesis